VLIAGSAGVMRDLIRLVRQAAYADALTQEPELALEDFLARYFAARGVPGLSILLERALTAGQVLLLLDGLDEVGPRADRHRVAERVTAFLEAHSRLRAVVTSRVVGYHEAPLPDRYPHYMLNPFSWPEEVSLFAHQWCLAYELQAGDTPQARERARREAERLLRAIESRPHIQELAGNPLLLTIIALIQRQGVELPEHRVELYREMVRTLVETWCRARSLEEGRVVGEPLAEAEAVEVLGPLALWMHRNYPGGTAPAREVEEQIVRRLVARGEPPESARRAARHFLDLVQRQTGILEVRKEEYELVRDLVEGDRNPFSGRKRVSERGRVSWQVRLPTEEEWLLAAGADDGREYPWGDGFHESRANTAESGIGNTTPVAMYPTGASPHGVMDMAGNVWEWTASRYRKGMSRVIRGGSWYSNMDYARCDFRYGLDPVFSLNVIGFRLVAPVF